MPNFRIATQSLRKGDTLPELQDILNESFIQETDGKWRTPDPNEAKDREALRSKVLLKEFAAYVTAINQPKAKKLKEDLQVLEKTYEEIEIEHTSLLKKAVILRMTLLPQDFVTRITNDP